MKKILMVIPTMGRSEMVREVLDFELSYYKKYPISVCYYDSSTDDKTKQVIEDASAKNAFDIIYKKTNSKLCLDYKIVEIFKELKTLEYDYYWLINDSISILEEMLQYVFEIIEKDYDLIRLPLSGAGKKEDYITDSPNDWFCNCSQGMAHMASTIMSKSLLNMPIDWQELCEKYIMNNTLDDMHGYFFTVGFYLEQILRLDNFSGIFIGNRYKWRRDSSLKGKQIYWRRYVFETWAKSYPETILKLPPIYTDKENVIRKSDNIVSERFSKEMLIYYRINGLYDIDKFEKFRNYFKYITTENEDVCCEIAKTPMEVLKRKYPNLIALEEEWEVKLEKIEKIIGNNSFYIYGAGLYGQKVVNKLQSDGFGKLINGILVTSKEENADRICKINVYDIDEVKLTEESYIVVCALPGTAEKIKKELEKRHFKKYIGLFDV